MLPLQITLEGFMSYRDAATISFEGASLWMLAGNNGAGKSSVFDAMRWMLFNRHRGGAQGHEALIHHDKNRLRVAFDLEIAAGRFRLLRTLSRGGKSSWQIEKLLENETEKVPETDMRDGYNRWLEDHIGLSDETFGAAFYLAQGKGDAILSAKPEERYEMLAEIVDLSAFARLHESAKTSASELESQSRLQRLQFEAAPGVETTEIEARRHNLGELTQQIDVFATQIAQLTGLEPWAMQWQGFETARLEIEKNLHQARELLGDSAQIERDAARWSELQKLLPPLENWLAQRTRLAHNAREREAANLKLQAANAAREALSRDLETATKAGDEQENARRNHEAARLAALTRQNELAPRLAQADALETGRARLAELATQRRAFPAALEAQKQALERQIENAKSSQIALGVLRRFDRERKAWRAALEKTEAASQRQVELENALPALQKEREMGATQLENARQTATKALEILAAAQARDADAQTALTRFGEVKDEPNCHFCGQKLTAEHAEREENRLWQASRSAQQEAEAAQAACDEAKFALETAQSHFDSVQSEAIKAQNALEKRQAEIRTLLLAGENASANAAEALRELEAEFAARFDGEARREWNQSRVAMALQNPFPAAFDFESLQHTAQQLPRDEAQLQKVANQLSAQSKIAAQIEAVEAQIEPLRRDFALRAQFDDAALHELRLEVAKLKTALDAANAALQNGLEALQKARAAVKKLEKSLETARETITTLQNQLAGREAAQHEIERALRQFEAEHTGLLDLFRADENQLRADYSRWQAEKSRLESSDLSARSTALQQARERVSHLENEAARLEKSLETVPQAARRAPDALRLEIDGLRREVEERETVRRERELDLARLERLFDERNALQKALLDIETRARQHKTLADLLGPQQLQRFLLREAENGIVDEANAVLDRISSGTLRLELRADDDEVAGARKVAPKVLDVAVYQESGEGQSRAMLPAFLSGSQRFRVAVALALGIGRFATRGQGHSKLESVIIDEGFGSLDKIGRAEMIDELKALGDELKRVILVSHQEEFADAFPNRYLIEHDGVASTARLMVG